jgi:hypothetical protein
MFSGVTPDEEVCNRALLQELNDALLAIPSREQKVIEMRFGLVDGDSKTLAEVSSVMGVSRERVRQLEMRGLMRLRGIARERGRGFFHEAHQAAEEERRRAWNEEDRRKEANVRQVARNNARAVQVLNRLPRDQDGNFTCSASSVWREGVPIPVRHVDAFMNDDGSVWRCPNCSLCWPSDEVSFAKKLWLCWLVGTDCDRALIRKANIDLRKLQSLADSTPCRVKEGHSK